MKQEPIVRLTTRGVTRIIRGNINFSLLRNLYRKAMNPMLLTKVNLRKFLVFSTFGEYRKFRRICSPNPGVTHIFQTNILGNLAKSSSAGELLRTLRQKILWETFSDIPFSLARRAGVFPQYLHLRERDCYRISKKIRGSYKNSQHNVINTESSIFIRRLGSFWLGRLPLILRVLREAHGPSAITGKLTPAAVQVYLQQYNAHALRTLLESQKKSLERFAKDYTRKFAKNRLNYFKEPFIPLGEARAAQDLNNNPLYHPIMPLRVTYKRSGNNIFSSVQLSFPRKTFLTLSGGSTGLKGRRKGTTNAAEQLGKALGDRFFGNANKVLSYEKALSLENNVNFFADFVVEGENFDTIAKSFLSGVLKSKRKFIPAEKANKVISLKKTILERSFKIENILFDTRAPHNGTRKKSKRRV